MYYSIFLYLLYFHEIRKYKTMQFVYFLLQSSTFAPTTGSQSRVSDAGDSYTAPEVKMAADDFFSKYDNNIAKLKGEVARMETNAG